jgi:hypothetical protein
LLGKTEGQTALEDEGKGEKIVLKCTFRKGMEQGATDLYD